MGTENLGNQVIHWRYKQPAITEDINKWFYNIFASGVFNGGEISVGTNNPLTGIYTVLIDPIAVLIDTPSEQMVKVQTQEQVEINVSPDAPIIVCSFLWQNNVENYMDFIAKNEISIVATDIIIGEAVFDNDLNLIEIDYLKKKLGALKID